jgi:hypothetical protein
LEYRSRRGVSALFLFLCGVSISSGGGVGAPAGVEGVALSTLTGVASGRLFSLSMSMASK